MACWQDKIAERLNDYTKNRPALVSEIGVPHLDPTLRSAFNHVKSDFTTESDALAAVAALALAGVSMLTELGKQHGNDVVARACQLWQRSVKAPTSNSRFEGRLRKATNYEEADLVYFVTRAVIRLLRCPYPSMDVHRPTCEIVWRVVDIALITTAYRRVCGDKKADTIIAALAKALAA